MPLKLNKIQNLNGLLIAAAIICIRTNFSWYRTKQEMFHPAHGNHLCFNQSYKFHFSCQSTVSQGLRARTWGLYSKPSDITVGRNQTAQREKKNLPYPSRKSHSTYSGRYNRTVKVSANTELHLWLRTAIEQSLTIKGLNLSGCWDFYLLFFFNEICPWTCHS